MKQPRRHYNDVMISTMASQISSLTIVYWSLYSGGVQRKHQSSASLAFVRRIHRWPVNSSHKEPGTRKMFPCDDVIMNMTRHRPPMILIQRESVMRCKIPSRHHGIPWSNDDPIQSVLSGAPFTSNKLQPWHGWVITITKVKCETKLLVHSQTSTTAPSKV